MGNQSFKQRFLYPKGNTRDRSAAPRNQVLPCYTGATEELDLWIDVLPPALLVTVSIHTGVSMLLALAASSAVAALV